MRGWSQVAASTGGDYMAMEYVDSTSGRSARFACEARSSRADQRRKNRSLHDLSQELEEGVVAQSWMLSHLDRGRNEKNRRLTYLDVKKIIERKLSHQKRGILTDAEISEAVSEYKDMREQRELDSVVVAKEIKRLNDAMFRCNNEPVGSMSTGMERGRVRAFLASLTTFLLRL